MSLFCELGYSVFLTQRYFGGDLWCDSPSSESPKGQPNPENNIHHLGFIWPRKQKLSGAEIPQKELKFLVPIPFPPLLPYPTPTSSSPSSSTSSYETRSFSFTFKHIYKFFQTYFAVILKQIHLNCLPLCSPLSTPLNSTASNFILDFSTWNTWKMAARSTGWHCVSNCHCLATQLPLERPLLSTSQNSHL